MSLLNIDFKNEETHEEPILKRSLIYVTIKLSYLIIIILRLRFIPLSIIRR